MDLRKTPIEPFGLMIEPASKDAEIPSLNLAMLRELHRSEHLLVLRGFRSFDGPEDFAQYCELWGEIALWPFGKVLELVEQRNPEDHIFDNNYVPMHWDGMYRPQVPEYQIFLCVSAPLGDQGGRTTFSNTALALEKADYATRALWKRVTGTYQRKMEYYNSRTIAPLITDHPTKSMQVIRYCEPPRADDENFINHPEIQFLGVNGSDLTHLHQSLRDALYSAQAFYAHAWQTGDIVITDNHLLLHGREAFASGAPRHLRRVHVLGAPPLTNPHLVFHQ